MEKYQHVFDRFIQFETHLDGFKLARREKRNKPEVLAYSANLEENLIDGINHLIWKDYAITGVHEFYAPTRLRLLYGFSQPFICLLPQNYFSSTTKRIGVAPVIASVLSSSMVASSMLRVVKLYTVYWFSPVSTVYCRVRR